jgi:hypothetical protein
MIGSNAWNNAPTASATEGRTDEQHAQSVRPIRSVNHNRCEAPGLCSPLMRSKRPVASLICVLRIRRTSHQNSQLRRPQGPINMKFSWQATDSLFTGTRPKVSHRSRRPVADSAAFRDTATDFRDERLPPLFSECDAPSAPAFLIAGDPGVPKLTPWAF